MADEKTASRTKKMPSVRLQRCLALFVVMEIELLGAKTLSSTTVLKCWKSAEQATGPPGAITGGPAGSTTGLERDAEGELQLPHGNVRVQVADDAAIRAVDAARARRVRNVQRRVVEQVEDLELELSLHPLRQGNVLHQGRVSHKLTRPTEGVATHIAERTERRHQEGSRAVRRTNRTGHRRKETDRVCSRIESTRTHVEARALVRTAVAAATRTVEVRIQVLLLAALGEGRRKGRTALVRCHAADGVAANQVIHPTTAMREEHTVLAEWQLIHAAQHKNMRAVRIVRSVAHTRIPCKHRVVGIVHGLRPGVVRIELQTMRKALVQLRLQRVVMRVASWSSRGHAVAAARHNSAVVVLHELAVVRPALCDVPRSKLGRSSRKHRSIQVIPIRLARIDALRMVTYVGNLERRARAELLLQRKVPLVHLRQLNTLRTELRIERIAQRN